MKKDPVGDVTSIPEENNKNAQGLGASCGGREQDWLDFTRQNPRCQAEIAPVLEMPYSSLVCPNCGNALDQTGSCTDCLYFDGGAFIAWFGLYDREVARHGQ